MNRIKQREKSRKPEPYIPPDETGSDGLPGLFMENLAAGGGRGYQVARANLDSVFHELFSDRGTIMNFSGFLDIPSNTVNEDDTGLLIVDGLIGVAGNGAVWLTEKEIGNRKNPFIAGELLIILPVERLLRDLFLAYRMIELSSGFGIWIAGPSKTADIEQSLVFGAQGTLRHTVFILS